ncbi:unnamed protein product, partial [Mycena citricolor]
MARDRAAGFLGLEHMDIADGHYAVHFAQMEATVVSQLVHVKGLESDHTLIVESRETSRELEHIGIFRQ